MSESDFKEWMKGEIGEIKADLRKLDRKVQDNTDTLNKYLWMWRAIRYTGGACAVLIVSNWDAFLKLLLRH